MREKLLFGALFLASLAAVAGACVSNSNAPPGSSEDAGGEDSALVPDDTGSPEDAGEPHDATDASDSAIPDSSEPSSDASDASTSDASDGQTPAPTLLATDVNNPEGVTVANGHLYWVDYGNGTLVTCAVASCTPSVLLTGYTNPQGITNDGTSLFWAANTAQPGGSIFSASITACASGASACAASVETIGTNLAYPGDVSVDSSNVYFTGINLYEGGTNDALFACAKTGCATDGGAPVVLVTGLSEDPSGTFVLGTSLYFGQYSVGVSVCTLPGCASPTAIQGPGFAVAGIAADATNLYWSYAPSGPSSSANGAVYSCPLAGCVGSSPVLLGTGLGYPNRIAVDGSHVYVSVGGQNDGDDAGMYNGVYEVAK